MHNHTDERTSENRLADEKSYYLLQHAANPVDWYPWGDEAFEKAKREDKPIFLSIGYSTCHWCHVMAHESFEDEEVGRKLNESFVSIKVDREERPDIDMVYMAACQAINLRGGWPLSIFMTPDGEPFYAGTYFPKSSRMGMPGFLDILAPIAKAWKNDRSPLLEASKKIVKVIQPRLSSGSVTELSLETLGKAYDQFVKDFDPRWGGFGSAPKFPTPHNLNFLLRWYRRSGDVNALNMVEKTLDAMRSGGIFDQIGFGYSRYSLDDRWLVPHFEKMLYDQAMLAMAYTETYQVTGEQRHTRVVAEILAYVLRDMTDPEGPFYTAEDADSEGKEGLFYLWKPTEVKAHLGKDLGELFCRFYDIGPQGNFEDGRSIPHIRIPTREFADRENMDASELERLLEEARERLFAIRQQRIHPLKDDKVLTSWNGLMIAAMAKAYQALGDQTYADAARRAADFVLENLKKPGPRLFRRYRQGDVAYPGFLDDYAFIIWGLIELYEATFEVSYLEEAVDLNNAMMDLFWDPRDGGFFFSGKENEVLIKRSKEIYDGAIPGSNSVAVFNLARLARITGNAELWEKAEQVAGIFAKRVNAYPSAYTHFLAAMDFMIGPSWELVIVEDRDRGRTNGLIEAVRRSFVPNKVLLLRSKGDAGERLATLAPFVKDLPEIKDRAAAFLCQNNTCTERPITEAEELKAAIV